MSETMRTWAVGVRWTVEVEAEIEVEARSAAEAESIARYRVREDIEGMAEAVSVEAYENLRDSGPEAMAPDQDTVSFTVQGEVQSDCPRNRTTTACPCPDCR